MLRARDAPSPFRRLGRGDAVGVPENGVRPGLQNRARLLRFSGEAALWPSGRAGARRALRRLAGKLPEEASGMNVTVYTTPT